MANPVLRSKGIAFALFLMLLLSGCMELSVQQKFYPNGRSKVVQQIHISKMLPALNSSGLSVQDGESGIAAWDRFINESCDNISQLDPEAICHRVGGWLVIDQDKVASDDYVFKSYDQFPYTIYELTLLAPPEVPFKMPLNETPSALKTSRYFTNASVQTAIALRAAGMSYRYYIEMPGEIYESNAGMKVGKGLEFNVFEQVEARKPVIVKSRTLNFTQIAVALIFALDIILLFDVIAIFAFRWAESHKEEIRKLRRQAAERRAAQRAAKLRKKLKGYQVYTFDDEEGSISKLDVESRKKKN